MTRAHDEIERVREEKQGADLYDQLLWRIKLLGGNVNLTETANRRAFDDLLEAFVPDGHDLVLQPSQPCQATLERGGEVRFTGYLVSGGNITAELERVLHVPARTAYHRRFRVVPMFRGNRIAPRSLVRSVALYDALAFDQIRLRATHSGTWYWALWGFHFEVASEVERIQNHAQEVIDALGGGLDATTLTHPLQFARLGEPAVISFDALADELPIGGRRTKTSLIRMGLGCTIRSRSAESSF
jgi:hypothetical protein